MSNSSDVVLGGIVQSIGGYRYNFRVCCADVDQLKRVKKHLIDYFGIIDVECEVESGVFDE